MDRIEFAKNVLKFAKEAGFKLKSKKKIGEEDFEKAAKTPNGDYWHSSVTKKQDEKEYNKKSFLAFILDEDEESDDSRYNDFSLVFFPQISEDKVTKCLICLGVGTNGFSKDSEIASLPYPRRFFLKMQKYGAILHFKQNFENIEYTIPDLLDRMDDYGQIEKYGNYLQICEFEERFDTKEEITLPSKEKISLPKSIIRWILFYALFRGWKKEGELKKLLDLDKVYDIKKPTGEEDKKDEKEIDEILNIIQSDKYVILQGAPGVGKTYTTSKISKHFKETVFEQFHAETTYSDFIYGIMPDTKASELKYTEKKGVLYKAIDEALVALGKKGKEKEWDYLKKPLEPDCSYSYSKNTAVLLIIDEINRANLANVLGPVFYLFERSSQNRTNLITIGDKEICRLPENLYVVGTMNTADRSLAVVDFALRRRFTWITLKPKNLSEEEKKGKLDPPYNHFNEGEFNWFKKTFEKYATDAELNLQPGQEYFLTTPPEKELHNPEHPMYNMMKYKLMPLIKEYLNEGFLQRAKDEFSIYFFNEWNLNLYE